MNSPTLYIKRLTRSPNYSSLLKNSSFLKCFSKPNELANSIIESLKRPEKQKKPSKLITNFDELKASKLEPTAEKIRRSSLKLEESLIYSNISKISKNSFESTDEDINFDKEDYAKIIENSVINSIDLDFMNNNEPKKEISLKRYTIFNIKRKNISEFSNFINKGKIGYICKWCNAKFNKPCALGGHVSKLHKGKSIFYQQRKEKRILRETERLRNSYLKNICN